MEIRFRVWNGYKMLYPDKYRDIYEEYFLRSDGSIWEFEGPHYEASMEAIERCIPMLSTGLKDRNGKEIWAGDIVKYKRPGEPEVTAEAGITALFRIQNVNVIIDPEIQKEWTKEEYDYEALGNKYENPELLAEVA